MKPDGVVSLLLSLFFLPHVIVYNYLIEEKHVIMMLLVMNEI